MEKQAWVNTEAVERRHEIAKWVATLDDKKTELLGLLIMEARERAMLELMAEIEKSPLVEVSSSFTLTKGNSFRLISLL
jgi:hypothetical protein